MKKIVFPSLALLFIAACIMSVQGFFGKGAPAVELSLEDMATLNGGTTCYDKTSIDPSGSDPICDYVRRPYCDNYGGTKDYGTEYCDSSKPVWLNCTDEVVGKRYYDWYCADAPDYRCEERGSLYGDKEQVTDRNTACPSTT